ncbi:hypothetical protein J5U23_01449 [Saccharolobus shibatae B12]|uniref:Uncharacterized protein n=1 Tax=Saccharolobus shibatae (strain ATCC 51178 / DSM 5389 / JCM 8931 / NBRC 15437 / B12) TaxID=523848 RepID=A0A8F5BNJ6_SACSH|nr:hypothetical protein J5U23_01449 [Saccharolobus shibatae B12]
MVRFITRLVFFNHVLSLSDEPNYVKYLSENHYNFIVLINNE